MFILTIYLFVSLISFVAGYFFLQVGIKISYIKLGKRRAVSFYESSAIFGI